MTHDDPMIDDPASNPADHFRLAVLVVIVAVGFSESSGENLDTEFP